MQTKQFFALLIGSFIFIPSVFATETPTLYTITDPIAAKTPAKVAYDLAFPGTLPDSPLYPIKQLRDRLVRTSLPYTQKKLEYYLLQTDKGISATAILVDKGNISLAKSTALKAENNYTMLVADHESMYRSGVKITKEFTDKAQLAAQKHQEVLRYLADRVTGNDAKMFRQVAEFSQRNLAELTRFINDPQKKAN